MQSLGSSDPPLVPSCSVATSTLLGLATLLDLMLSHVACLEACSHRIQSPPFVSPTRRVLLGSTHAMMRF